VRVDALERFLEFDLTLPYGWQDIVEPSGVRILAQHDLGTGAIQASNQYADFFEEHPHLLASALLHEWDMWHCAMGNSTPMGARYPFPACRCHHHFFTARVRCPGASTKTCSDAQ
jgi:hypothetical protein